MVSLSPDPASRPGVFSVHSGGLSQKDSVPASGFDEAAGELDRSGHMRETRQYAPAKHCRGLFLSSQVCVAPRTATLALARSPIRVPFCA